MSGRSSKKGKKKISQAAGPSTYSAAGTQSSETSLTRPTESLIMDTDSNTSLMQSDQFEKEMSNLSQNVLSADKVSELLLFFIDKNKSSLNDWINQNVAFAGFNAVEMRKKIASKLNVEQVMMAIIIGLVRGNNVSRIQNTMRSVQAKRKFTDLVKIAKIQDRVKGDYACITLSRIIACFPEVVCRILFREEIPMAVSSEQIKKLYPEYPMSARHQACAGIIPQSLSDQEIAMAMDVIMVPFMMTSEVINTRNPEWKSKTPQMKAESSGVFLNNALSSQVLSESERKAHAMTIGMVVGDGHLTTVWRTAAGFAKSWMTTKYSHSFQD